MALLGALEAIRSGTTLVLEEGSALDHYAGALVDTGLRLALCERAWDRAKASVGQPGELVVDPALGETGVQRIRELHARWHGAGQGRVQTGLAAWAPDMCTPELLGRLRKLQDELGVLASVHLNQVWGEVAAVQEHRGALPTEYLARTGFLSERLVAAHCRCMSPEEERTLGAARAAVAVNPAIAARRGLAARVDDLERAGCTITLGTDNMAEDMVEVVRTALFMERVRRQDGRRPTPEQALTWATRNGYRALGVPDGGWLAPGNRADLIVIDLQRPHLTPALRVVSDVVHNGQAGDVRSVMVDGRWLMREHRVLTLDEPAVVADAERIARAAWGRLFAERPELPRPAGLDLTPR
jgi:5-methylthioadenosine/S-adenosylhomocysteine deaminase